MTNAERKCHWVVEVTRADGLPLFRARGLNQKGVAAAIRRALAGNLEYPERPHQTQVTVRWDGPEPQKRKRAPRHSEDWRDIANGTDEP